MLWVSSQTRLDACYDALELSMERNKGTIDTLMRAEKFIRKLKHQHRIILYQKLSYAKDYKIYGYADASHTNLPDKASSAEGHTIQMQ